MFKISKNHSKIVFIIAFPFFLFGLKFYYQSQRANRLETFSTHFNKNKIYNQILGSYIKIHIPYERAKLKQLINSNIKILTIIQNNDGFVIFCLPEEDKPRIMEDIPVEKIHLIKTTSIYIN